MRLEDTPTIAQLDIQTMRRVMVHTISELKWNQSPVDTCLGGFMEMFRVRLIHLVGDNTGYREVNLIKTLVSTEPKMVSRLTYSTLANVEKYFTYYSGKRKKPKIKYQLKDFYGIIQRCVQMKRDDLYPPEEMVLLTNILALYNKDHLVLDVNVREYLDYLYYQEHSSKSLTAHECILYDKSGAFRRLCKVIESKGFMLNRELPPSSTEYYVDLISTLAFIYSLFVLSRHDYGPAHKGTEIVYRKLLNDFRDYIHLNEDILSQQSLP